MIVSKMDYEEMCEFLKKETGNSFSAIYYVLPENTMECRLQIISNDTDISNFFVIAFSYGKLELYLDNVVGHS